MENPDQLEEILYRFRDQALLTQAMTHRSWAHEQVSPRAQRSARNLLTKRSSSSAFDPNDIADYLFKAYPNATEGELWMKHRLVGARPGQDLD